MKNVSKLFRMMRQALALYRELRGYWQAHQRDRRLKGRNPIVRRLNEYHHGPFLVDPTIKGRIAHQEWRMNRNGRV